MDRTATDIFERTDLQKQGILDRLRDKGYRITSQRLALIEVLLEHDCASCKEIYFFASKKDGNIGMATVYRFMNVLEEIGALRWKNGYQFRHDENKEKPLFKVIFEDGKTAYLEKASLISLLENGLSGRPGENRKISDIVPIDF